MASTPLDTIPEEPIAAPTPPNSPAAVTTPPPTPARVTADPPQTKPTKNAGRVASGKRLAERNRLAREAKKKAEAEAASAARASTSVSESTRASDSGGSLSLSTLLGIGGLIVSIGGLCYQREAIQARFRAAPPATPAPPTPAPAPAPAPAPSRIPVKKGASRKWGKLKPIVYPHHEP